MSYTNDIITFLKKHLTTAGITEQKVLLEDELLKNYNTLPLSVIKLLDTTYDNKFTQRGEVIYHTDISYDATYLAEANTSVIVAIVNKSLENILDHHDEFLQTFYKNQFVTSTHTNYFYSFDRSKLISLQENKRDLKAVSFLFNFRYYVYSYTEITSVSDTTLETDVELRG